MVPVFCRSWPDFVAGAVKTAMEIEERDRRDISGEGPTIEIEEGM